jgi:hypothetical protein
MLAAALLSACLHTMSAATLTIPSPITVLGTDVFTGPTFTLTSDYSATDILSFSVSGIVYLQPGSTFGTNAAGVVVVAGSTGVGGALPNAGGTYGSLLLGGGSLPFVQLIAASAATGLGSANPPTEFAFSDTLGNIFGSGLTAGTELEFRISDINTGDNSGQFALTPPDIDGVPEPGTWALMLGGLAAMSATRYRNSKKNN